MKSLICLLLSLYVLTLSMLPCADDGLELRPDSSSVSVAADPLSCAPDDSCDDYCSPLCICACCGTVVDQPPVFAFALSAIGPAPVVDYGATPVNSSLLSVFLATWQPPQLS